jgi:RNA polymerase sigma-70 factor (ECF subfamily)
MLGEPAAGTDAAPGTGPAHPRSFEEFYRAQADRVYRSLAVTLGSPHLAREATDEAMARACASWRRVAELDNPGGWVYRVGLNWATSWWRKVRREQP